MTIPLVSCGNHPLCALGIIIMWFKDRNIRVVWYVYILWLFSNTHTPYSTFQKKIWIIHFFPRTKQIRNTGRLGFLKRKAPLLRYALYMWHCAQKRQHNNSYRTAVDITLWETCDPVLCNTHVISCFTTPYSIFFFFQKFCDESLLNQKIFHTFFQLIYSILRIGILISIGTSLEFLISVFQYKITNRKQV